MKRAGIILLCVIFSVSAIVAQPRVMTLKTSKTKGETIELKMVAGGNVSIDLGTGVAEPVQVSKNFSQPTSHTFTLPVNNAEIKIFGNNLTYLDCSKNALTVLDVSDNTYLRTLRCQNNQLRSLDISNNNALTFLWCMMNLLEELDVKNNSELVQLSITGNKITSLDVSKNAKLNTLLCAQNRLGNLDVSNNPALKALDVRNIGMSKLDVSKNPNLVSLSIQNDGHYNANNFSACALNELYNSLPVQMGIINVVNSLYKGRVNNDIDGSNKILANNRGWLVYDVNGKKELTGDGGACK